MYAMVIIKDKPLIAKIICPMIWRFFIFRSDLSLSSLQHQSSSGPKKDFSEFATMVKIKPTSKSIMVKGRDRRANFLQKSGPLHSPDGLLYLWSKTNPGKARFRRFILLQQTVQVVIITSSKKRVLVGLRLLNKAFYAMTCYDAATSFLFGGFPFQNKMTTPPPPPPQPPITHCGLSSAPQNEIRLDSFGNILS